MSSYWASCKAKKREVSKLVRDTEQDITEYKFTAASSSANVDCFESTDPPTTTSSECQLDGLPTNPDFSLNRLLIISDQSENINLQTPVSSPDLNFESEGGADKIESKDDSDSDEPNEDLFILSLRYWATSYSVSLAVALLSFALYLKNIAWNTSTCAYH